MFLAERENGDPFFSWTNLSGLLTDGVKYFFFFWAVLTGFRLFFIIWMQDYMGPDVRWEEIGTALWRGARLSCQSAGALTLAVFLPAALMRGFWQRGSRLLWKLAAGTELVVLSVLSVGLFPYYRQFHSNYNQMLFQAADDDMTALFWSFVQEFYLPLRLAGALLLAYVLWKIWHRWMIRRRIAPGDYLNLPKPLRWLGRGLYLAFCGILVLLGIFGGSLTWKTAVDWENAGVTKDHLLNESILDIPQAVYRGWRMRHRMLACNGLDFTAERVRELAAQISGRPADTDDLDSYLLRQAAGAQIGKPKHIFVILSESYANWPLLEKYSKVPIAEGMRSLIRAEDSDYVPVFLPNGSSTVSAVTGIVTGFADANLYLTTMPEAFAEPYPTAGAPQMEQLGYETCFWYAGPASWERIESFVLAQGYDHFFSRGDFGDVPGSVWGCEDKYFYQKVLEGIPRETAGFHVLLNASNHSPYDVDLEQEGFPAEEVRASLPEELQEDEDLLRQLGHYWYADRELAKFVSAIKRELPDSLIVIAGDHADRYNIGKTPSLYERYGIPFIVTGKGVYHGILLPDAAGSQIDIVPTIIEMIAPEGFSYHALGSSMSRTNRRGVNYGFWVTRDAIGATDKIPLEPESVGAAVSAPEAMAGLEDYIDAVRSISWWRAKYGRILDEEKLSGNQ